MEKPNTEKNILNKQFENASQSEEAGLIIIWKRLCSGHSALSKDERGRKKIVRQK